MKSNIHTKNSRSLDIPTAHTTIQSTQPPPGPILPAIPTPRKDTEAHNPKQEAERLRQLEGRSRLLEKYYKKNLKMAFQQKIKAYRLQSYMDRKDHQQMLMEELQAREKDILQAKSHRTKQTRINLSLGRERANTRKQSITNRAKLSITEQHNTNIQSIRENLAREFTMKKKMRDELMQEKMQVREKKELLDQLYEMRKKELHAMVVKGELETIMERQERLLSLKDELREMIRSRSKKTIMSEESIEVVVPHSIINL